MIILSEIPFSLTLPLLPDFLFEIQQLKEMIEKSYEIKHVTSGVVIAPSRLKPPHTSFCKLNYVNSAIPVGWFWPWHCYYC